MAFKDVITVPNFVGIGKVIKEFELQVTTHTERRFGKLAFFY
jgi:hypothetical protein